MSGVIIFSLFASTWASSAPQANEYEKLARQYFEKWNAHDVPGLKALLAEDVTLRDWDIEKHGAETVAAATGGIFTAEPNIHIEIEKVHVSESTKTAACEVLVQLRNAKNKVQKVAKLITFDTAGKITKVSAFKG